MRLRHRFLVLAPLALLALTPALPAQNWTAVTAGAPEVAEAPESTATPQAAEAPVAPADIQGPDEARTLIFLRDSDDGVRQLEPVTAWGGYLGVAVSDLTPELRRHFGLPEDRGVLVGRVEPDSPAAAAGLLVGDFLLAVDGELIAGDRELRRTVVRKEPGTAVDVEVQREGRTLDFQVELAQRPRLRVDLGRAMAHPGIPPVEIQIPDALERLEGLDIHTIDIDPERLEAVMREFREGLAPEIEARVDADRERNRELESRLHELEGRLQELERELEAMSDDG